MSIRTQPDSRELISTFPNDITLVPDESFDLSGNDLNVLSGKGIKVKKQPLRRVEFAPGGGLYCYFAKTAPGEPERYDVLFPSLGFKFNTELAEQVGSEMASNGDILVNDHQMTTVGNVWAADDGVKGLDQIIVAQAQAAISCTQIHNNLRTAENGIETRTRAAVTRTNQGNG